MKYLLALQLALLAISVQSAPTCCPAECKLPNCLRKSTSAPGGLTKEDTPQMVFLTFDGAITRAQIANYTSILKNRINPNGCQIAATFFTYHPNNNYLYTCWLGNNGSEIATSSLSHSTPADAWKTKPVDDWTNEMSGMQSILTKYGLVPSNAIKGSRSPYLQSAGDNTIQAITRANMQYDCSYPTNKEIIWPYTLDCGFEQDCVIPPCPSGCHPGVWTFPILSLQDANGILGAFADAFPLNTSDQTEEFLRKNFDRITGENKTPFGIHLQGDRWFKNNLEVLQGLMKFLDYLITKDDVFIVSLSQALEWMKNPLPLKQLQDQNVGPFKCPEPKYNCGDGSRTCYFSESPIGETSMAFSKTITTPCPVNYPWVGNPNGN